MSGNNHDSPHATSRHGSTVETYACLQCGLNVPARAPDGERRDHCPACLYSWHGTAPADDEPECGSRMRPISIAVLRSGDWMLIHRCVGCAALTSSAVARDDNQIMLVRMAVRPLAEPPFPLESFGSL